MAVTDPNQYFQAKKRMTRLKAKASTWMQVIEYATQRRNRNLADIDALRSAILAYEENLPQD